MFDDNYDRADSSGDNLSLKKCCDLYLGVINRDDVDYMDNFKNLIRPMELADEIHIKYTFENIIDIYFEHLYVFKGDKEKRETLFPKFTYLELMEKYSAKYLLSPDAVTHFHNIVFVQLKEKKTVYK